MNRDVSSKVWLVCGVALFYFIVNSMSVAFKWRLKLPGLTFEDWDPYAVSLVAVPIALVGIIWQCLIGLISARASAETAVKRRLPKPFALDDQDSALLHAAQLFAFLVVPVVGSVVLFVKFLSGSFCRQASDPSASGCGTEGYERVGADHFTYVPLSEVFFSRSYIYEGGADYWPFWEPMIFATIAFLAAVALAAFVHALLFPHSTGLRPAVRAQ